MNDNFYDIAYSFSSDNPFPNDTGKQKLNTLRKMVKQNLSIDFGEIEQLIKFYDLNDNITQLYGVEDKTKPITETFMFNDIKNVVQTIPQLKYFNHWVDQFNAIPDPYDKSNNISGGNKDDNQAEQEQTTQIEQSKEQPKEEQKPSLLSKLKQSTDLLPDETKWASVIPITPSKFDYSKTGGLTNYDITNENPLTYEDIRKLTVNIARSKLKNIVEKSEQVLALEKAKRKELMANIQKYKNIKAIGVMVEDNIQEMNLDQLEHTLNHCEHLFQSQKLKEMIKRGANFGSLLTSTVFPNGIKVGNKRIKMKGAAKTIIDNIFDSQSTIGVAFQNIVEKHHWSITDEMVLTLSLGEMFISNIGVEKIEPEPQQQTAPPVYDTRTGYATGQTYTTTPAAPPYTTASTQKLANKVAAQQTSQQATNKSAQNGNMSNNNIEEEDDEEEDYGYYDEEEDNE